jgi:hypothetical protein
VSTTLPVPLELELPGPAWSPADPAALGITGAAFTAVRDELTPGYHPTLVISGEERYDDTSLLELADESAWVLREETPHLRLLHREQVGSDRAPAVTQLIAAGINLEGRDLELVQAQVLTALLDVHDPRKRVVVLYKTTCLAEDWPVLGRELQDLMRTVRPLAPPETPA